MPSVEHTSLLMPFNGAWRIGDAPPGTDDENYSSRFLDVSEKDKKFIQSARALLNCITPSFLPVQA